MNASKALNYNEQKLQKGLAVCIGGNGCLVAADQLNFYQKLAFIENRNSLNQRATTKTLHVSLNFSPIEEFTPDQLMSIAADYMQQLGFGNQPYFVYQHHDAGHPHVHMISSCIRADGTRINTHNIGRNQSEFARKYVEVKYQLEKAENHRRTNAMSIQPFKLEKLEYGKSETRRGIASIVQAVMGTYNFTSLPEYNAVLRQFNVIADRGAEDSFTFRKNGLVYRVLDEQGEKKGVPIKASALPGNPGVKNLNLKFEYNRKHREPLRLKLKALLDNALTKSPKSIAELSSELKDQNVHVLTRKNEEGRIYGITFVDQGNRSVFNGSEIGKTYSAAGLIKQTNGTRKYKPKATSFNQNKELIEFNGLSLVTEIINPVDESTFIPYHLRKKKKKIRRS